MKKNKKNKKGFTLIELIAVIVILGILMIVAIPAVTRYIDNSKKEAFIKEINSLVDTVRYGINSGDSNYLNKKTFDLTKIELEKGKNTVKKGNLIVDNDRYIVKVVDEENNFCLSSTNINSLDKSMIKHCNTGYEYEIGEIVFFADATWRVIRNSSFSEEDDYVFLMKEKALDTDEIGNDYSIKLGQEAMPYMAYNWGNTCHYNSYTYGTQRWDSITNGCGTDYDYSRVKNFLEEVYINTLGASNLKEVEGYKIRLITAYELQEYLGFELKKALVGRNTYRIVLRRTDLTPTWVYQDFAKDTYWGYWTMTVQNSNVDTASIYYVDAQKNSSGYAYPYQPKSVRPVINLLKTAIQ